MSKKVINIVAPNIKSGGGKELLEFLLEYINDNYEDLLVNVYIDSTLNVKSNDNRNVFVFNSELSKVIFFYQKFKDVIYFGNLPPLRKSTNSIVYFHNTYLLMSFKKILSSDIKFTTKLMLLAKQFYIKMFIKNIDAIGCQTGKIEKQFKAKYLNKNIHILPIYRACKKNNIEKKFDYCYVSLAHPHKNYEKLFDALKILEAKKFHFVFAVTIELSRKDLIHTIEKINKNGVIKIVNFGTLSKEKVCKLYSMSKCLIFPSLEESFGLPLIEAVDMGLDVIASDLDYVYEVIKPSLTFNPNDAQSIAETILRYSEGQSQKSEAKIKNNISEFIELILTNQVIKVSNHEKLKEKLLIVGSFPSSDNDMYGGIAKSCQIILESVIASRYSIIPIDSTQFSNPPPGTTIRSVLAFRRVCILFYRLIFNSIDVALIFSSSGASAVEKGLMVWICYLFRCPILIFPRAGGLISQTSKSPSRLKVIKFLFSHATIFLCQGRNWEKFALNQLQISKLKVKVVRNWSATKAQVDVGQNRNYELSNNIPKIVFVGWLEDFKGVTELLEACKNIHNKGIKFHITLVGDGSAAISAKQFVSQNVLEECVTFNGWATTMKIESILQKSEIFVLPSWSEGMPNAMIEAMASGLAVVVTSVGEVSDYVENEKHALVVPPKDSKKLEQALIKLIVDKTIRKKIALGGFELAKKYFSEQENMALLSNIINATTKK